MAVEATETEPLETEEVLADSTETPEDVQLEATGEEPQAESTTDTEGKPRDQKGRFAPKATTEPQADALADEAITSEAPEIEQPEPERQPFVFKAARQDYTIEGAVYIPGEGLAIPDDQIAQVRQLLSEGAFARTEGRRQTQALEQKIKVLESAPKSTDAEDRANAILKQLDQVLSSPEAAMEFIANLEIQGPILRERARADLAEKRYNDIHSTKKTEESRQKEEQLESDKQTAWSETFQALKSDKAFALFRPEDWQQFEEEMQEFAPALFVKQGEDLFLNEAAIVKAARQRADLLKRVTSQATTLNKAQTFNAARANPGKAPPAVQVPQVEAEEAKPKNWDEWWARQNVRRY